VFEGFEGSKGSGMSLAAVYLVLAEKEITGKEIIFISLELTDEDKKARLASCKDDKSKDSLR